MTSRLALRSLGCALLLAAALPRASGADPYSVTLIWTAPGDDADVGRAAHYDLRWSTQAVGADTLAWWQGAHAASGLPRPSAAGFADSAVIRGLDPGTTYSFVLRTADDAGNVSGFSNVAVATTDPGAPPPRVSAASLAAGAGARIHAYPNPATDAVQFVVHVESASGGRVRLRLFDLAGRVVSDIADGLFPQGDSVISWPRTTRNGERVAPGFYESVGTVGEAMVRERIVLLP